MHPTMTISRGGFLVFIVLTIRSFGFSILLQSTCKSRPSLALTNLNTFLDIFGLGEWPHILYHEDILFQQFQTPVALTNLQRYVVETNYSWLQRFEREVLAR